MATENKKQETRKEDAEAQLTELDIHRVDGVKTPATGIPFLMLKTSDPDEMRVNAERLANAAAAVVDQIAAAHESGAEGRLLEMTEKTADALNVLAKMLNRDTKFVVGKKSTKTEKQTGEGGDAPAPTGEEPGAGQEDGDDMPNEVAKQLDERVSKIEKAIGEQTDLLKLLVDQKKPAAAASAVAKEDPKGKAESQQADPDAVAKSAKSQVRKMGEGLFDNVIFAKTQVLGR